MRLGPATADRALSMAAADHFDHLAQVVLNNLENQQDWTQLQCHKDSARPRILLSGLPPRRLYIHPDEQIEITKAEGLLGNGRRIPQPPEFEWVLPMHLAEKSSVGLFASVFDSINAKPPGAESEATVDGDEDVQWKQWRNAKRQKRILLAVVQDDSTVVYYIMHNGTVKPRQN